MCRLFAITSREPLSPMKAIHALNVMKEGHDGSGVDLFLTDLGGSFERFKGAPILSGIFSNEGIRTLDRCMMEMGFMVKYKLSIRPATKLPGGKPKRDGFISNITILVSTALRILCPAHPVAPLVVPAEIAFSLKRSVRRRLSRDVNWKERPMSMLLMRKNALVAASVSGPAPAGSGSSSKMSRLNSGCIE